MPWTPPPRKQNYPSDPWGRFCIHACACFKLIIVVVYFKNRNRVRVHVYTWVCIVKLLEQNSAFINALVSC